MANADDAQEVRPKRVTFTLSDIEIGMLERIVRARHPTDPRTASMTIRELIREEARRIEARERQERNGK